MKFAQKSSLPYLHLLGIFWRIKISRYSNEDKQPLMKLAIQYADKFPITFAYRPVVRPTEIEDLMSTRLTGTIAIHHNLAVAASLLDAGTRCGIIPILSNRSSGPMAIRGPQEYGRFALHHQ